MTNEKRWPQWLSIRHSEFVIRHFRSFSFPQKSLDRIVNRLFALNLARHEHFVLVAEGFLEDAEEFAAAVGTFDLAVAEEIALGEDLFAQKGEGRLVVLSPIVAIGELEAVDVPLGGVKVILE